MKIIYINLNKKITDFGKKGGGQKQIGLSQSTYVHDCLNVL